MNSKDFSELFIPNDNEKIIFFEESAKSVGFSILREYPSNIPFVPAKTLNGNKDSVAIIKVAYDSKESSNKVVLFSNVSKASKYLLNGHWDYNFGDEDSPTRESLAESKASRQPADLENFSDFTYDKHNRKFFDNKTGKETDLRKIADYMFGVHIKTVKTVAGAPFRLKMWIRQATIGFITFLKDSGEKLLNWWFGREIKDESGFSFGISPYPHKNLITTKDEKITLWGFNINITKNTVLTLGVIVTLLFLLHFFTGIMFFPIDFVYKYQDNWIFLPSFLISTFLLFDKALPHFILMLMNLLIRIRRWLWAMKVSIK